VKFCSFVTVVPLRARYAINLFNPLPDTFVLFKFSSEYNLAVVMLCFYCQLDQQLVSYIFFVMTRDALLTSHPVSAEIRDPDDITLYFDAISYDKVRYVTLRYNNNNNNNPICIAPACRMTSEALALRQICALVYRLHSHTALRSRGTCGKAQRHWSLRSSHSRATNIRTTTN